MLAVSDTGTGMDQATQARIFEPFFTTKQKGRGTGLGLSTVYGIVQQSHGAIWVYSEIGHGTTFKVYFPRVNEPASSRAEARKDRLPKGTETILVVEDEQSVRELVRRILERQGYRVLMAGTPLDALAVAGDHQGTIHLLMSDVILPQMNGRVLADRFLEKWPDTRLLFMSGYTDSAIVHRGIFDQGTPFLQKPFSPEALARKVRDVLSVKSSTETRN